MALLAPLCQRGHQDDQTSDGLSEPFSLKATRLSSTACTCALQTPHASIPSRRRWNVLCNSSCTLVGGHFHWHPTTFVQPGFALFCMASSGRFTDSVWPTANSGPTNPPGWSPHGLRRPPWSSCAGAPLTFFFLEGGTAAAFGGRQLSDSHIPAGTQPWCWRDNSSTGSQTPLQPRTLSQHARRGCFRVFRRCSLAQVPMGHSGTRFLLRRSQERSQLRRCCRTLSDETISVSIRSLFHNLTRNESDLLLQCVPCTRSW